MRETTLVPCFTCGQTLERVFQYEMQPSEATAFSTYGHYGSTFWDSFHGEALELIICDECLKKHIDRLVRLKRFRNVRCMNIDVGREWLEREPVPYFEGPEDNDDVEIEPEDIGTLTGYRIEWARNWQELKAMALEMVAERDKEEP